MLQKFLTSFQSRSLPHVPHVPAAPRLDLALARLISARVITGGLFEFFWIDVVKLGLFAVWCSAFFGFFAIRANSSECACIS